MAAKKILLVEGIDDEHVLKQLCGTSGIQKLDEGARGVSQWYRAISPSGREDGVPK